MEPWEQARVDQAETDEREFQRKFGFWFMIIGWSLVCLVLLFIVAALQGRVN